MTPLFRREAVEHQRQAWLGQIQLVRPLSLTLLSAAAVGALALTAAVLTWGEYTRKARVDGVLVPQGGVIRLVPAQTGMVVERQAQEGQAVRRGDPLFVLSLDRATARGDTQTRVQESLAARATSLRRAATEQSDLAAARRAALTERLATMRAEARQLEAESALHAQRLALARDGLTRLQALQRDQFISSAQVQSKTEEILGLQAQQQSVARQQVAHQRDMAALEAELRELPLRTRERQGELERDLAEVTQATAESEAQRRLVVRAPQDGIVTAVVAEPGQSVGSGATLASLMPAGAPLLAHLYAPSSAVGFVRPDQPVLLRYQAFPYQKFGHQAGRVVQVARTPLPADEAARAVGLAGAAQEPMYRITVELQRQSVPAYGLDQPLVAGMQLEADVLLDRRRLIEWIFEPLWSVAGRV